MSDKMAHRQSEVGEAPKDIIEVGRLCQACDEPAVYRMPDGHWCASCAAQVRFTPYFGD